MIVMYRAVAQFSQSSNIQLAIRTLSNIGSAFGISLQKLKSTGNGVFRCSLQRYHCANVGPQGLTLDPHTWSGTTKRISGLLLLTVIHDRQIRKWSGSTLSTSLHFSTVSEFLVRCGHPFHYEHGRIPMCSIRYAAAIGILHYMGNVKSLCSSLGLHQHWL